MSWTLIESQVLGASAASVTLGSGGTIPQTYKTLKLVISARSTRAAAVEDGFFIRLNGATTSSSWRALVGNGSAASSVSDSSGYGLTWVGRVPGAGVTASTFGSHEATIPNYAGSTNKPMSHDGVTENNATDSYQNAVATLWSNTSAVTSIDVVCGNANFLTASSFTLYGLK